jgi:SAM-dependent methyltransferase
MSAYDPIAEFYDLEYQQFKEDLPLYLELAERSGSPVLDVGCGTGRVTFALARAGLQVTGIDDSEAMLDRARAYMDRENSLRSRVDLLRTPADEFRCAHPYRLAIMAVNTFGHFLSQKDQIEVLDCLRCCLAPGGVLAVDMTPPDLTGLAQSEGPPVLHWEGRDDASGDFVQKWLSCRTDQVLQIQHYRIVYDTICHDGRVHRTAVEMPIRYTFRFEAGLLLERGGFAVEDVYGSYQLEDFDADSERMIIVARRR